MCMEDIRIGRESASGFKITTSTGGTPIMIAPPDTKRISMIVSGNTDGPVCIGTRVDQMQNFQGICLSAQMPYIVLTLENCGSQLWQAWYVVDPGQPVPVSVITTTLEKQ